MGLALMQLAPDLAASPSRTVHVRVGEAGANRTNELLERGRLPGIDPLGGGTDDVGRGDCSADGARRSRAGGLAAAAAEVDRDAAIDAARADMDMREENHAVGDERRRSYAFEVVIGEREIDRLALIVAAQVDMAGPGGGDRRVLMESDQ